MLKFVIFGVAAYLLFKLITGDKRKKNEVIHKKNEEMAANGVMVKDPVCGTYVPKETDIRVKHGDTIEYFCSYECRDKYVKQISDGK